jgi:hypothetical protein
VKRLLAIGVCLLAAPSALAQVPAPNRPADWNQHAARTSQPQVHPAVARIVAPGSGSISYGSGTLVYADERYGLVITNWHVINEATGPISVHFPDGFYSLGSVESVDRDWDLAAIAIHKPNARPVPLANEAPRPGEMLTIAGYGSGTYRAVSGPCTQYVAPGETFPFEMVEVAVSARQGDSGGPILNSRGELAGVLFGEGHGRTSGSYCGRVRWFLSSVVPSLPNSGSMVASAPLAPVPARPAVARTPTETARVALPPAPIVQTNAAAVSTRAVATTAPASTAVVASTRSTEPDEPQVQHLSWEDIAGQTLGEQAKTVLAGMGALMMFLHLLRWLGRERAEA